VQLDEGVDEIERVHWSDLDAEHLRDAARELDDVQP